MMNDPHVISLIYRIKHVDTVSYDTAAPFNYENELFSIVIADGQCRFEMKEHFAHVEQAREVIEPFIRQWELTTALDRGPGEFDLVFLTARVEDRSPSKGIVELTGSAICVATASAVGITGRGTYPQPPTDIAVDADVEAMAARYSRFREGKDTLAGVAYFCLTVLERAAGSRNSINDQFGVASKVIATLGRLTGEKGGAEARKDKGRAYEFTDEERNWLSDATKRLIRRAAEVARNPAVAKEMITMGQLPNLTSDHDLKR